MRHYSLIDNCLIHLDRAFKTIASDPLPTKRTYPAKNIAETIKQQDQKQAGAIMRINHVGEVCAQALYHGQALAAHTPIVQAYLEKAAQEEGDHLAWCGQRLQELRDRTSYLNPLWYMSAFTIGVMAGYWGDAWSLGLVAETEKQVVQHLQKQSRRLPIQDMRSATILAQMEQDEAKHQAEAWHLGARPLPTIIQSFMRLTSSIMVKMAYYI